jgi:hypothetical protein
MPGITFDKVVSDRDDVDCTWNGRAFKVWYRPSAFTPKAELLFQQHRRDEAWHSACAAVLAPMLDGWDVYETEADELADPPRPMPWTAEALQGMPGPFLVKILLHIAHKIAPNQVAHPDGDDADPKATARRTTRLPGRNVGR